MGVEGGHPAALDLFQDLRDARRPEEGAELAGTARLGGVLDGGARADGHRQGRLPTLAQHPVCVGHGVAQLPGQPAWLPGEIAGARPALEVATVSRRGDDEGPGHRLAGAQERSEADGLSPTSREIARGRMRTWPGRRATARTLRAPRRGAPGSWDRPRRRPVGLGGPLEDGHACPCCRRPSGGLRCERPSCRHPVATTAGSSYSRETMAAWDMMPPPSETAAAIRANTIDQLGAVSGHTRTSPSTSSSSSSTECTTRAGPSATPGDAARPLELAHARAAALSRRASARPCPC